ncbi:hypothetical protein L3X38_000954 [Prunus dulcis]|uniref:Uncharacterized protein n=1 Tax=Prunus dulcis TaxID=3755 RepID=A0AAD4ZII4_PRUDU|nr:hypothetical protein L3X38_000954 [Prunus dulcis]
MLCWNLTQPLQCIFSIKLWMPSTLLLHCYGATRTTSKNVGAALFIMSIVNAIWWLIDLLTWALALIWVSVPFMSGDEGGIVIPDSYRTRCHPYLRGLYRPRTVV